MTRHRYDDLLELIRSEKFDSKGLENLYKNTTKRILFNTIIYKAIDDAIQAKISEQLLDEIEDSDVPWIDSIIKSHIKVAKNMDYVFPLSVGDYTKNLNSKYGPKLKTCF